MTTIDDEQGVGTPASLINRGGLARHDSDAKWKNTLRHFDLKSWRLSPLAWISLVVLVITVIAAAIPGLIAPYSALKSHAIDRLQGPSASYLLGTDELGRDVLSRIIYGARTSAVVGSVAVAIGTGLGSLLGVFSGYMGGAIDTVIQRLVDAMMAFPGLILALAVMSIYGAGITQETIVIGVLLMPTQVRVVRSAVLGVRAEPYIESAIATGVPSVRIMLRHVLPNVVAPILVLASVSLGFAILIEGSLSYLGLGTPPPTPSWGGMIASGGGAYLLKAPTLELFPGVALSAVIVACNLLGDNLRDILDPRMRGS